jgi:hypothetical protein
MGLVSIIFKGVSADNDEDGVIYPVAHIVEVYDSGESIEKQLTERQVEDLLTNEDLVSSQRAQLKVVVTHMRRPSPETRPFSPIELKLVS